MRRVWQAHSGSLPAACPRHALAWGLPQMRLLWLSPRRSWLHAVHQGQPNALQARLLEVSRSTQQKEASLYSCNWMLMPLLHFLLLSLRLFGNTGYCAACSKVIPAFEMVMRARTNVYHLECFACQQCNHRWVLIDPSRRGREEANGEINNVNENL